MRIAVTCETEEADGLVPKSFRESPFLLLIDVEKNAIYHVYGRQDPDNMVFAEKILEHNCEAVICGPLEKEPFEKLAGAGVSRFDGSGRKVQKAFVRFLRNQLELIRDYIGGPGPTGHSHDFSCECEEGTEGEEGPVEAACANRHREDTLFELSEEEAQALPDELEIPDGLSREEIEGLLAEKIGPG